jgi:hypothetical protein
MKKWIAVAVIACALAFAYSKTTDESLATPPLGSIHIGHVAERVGFLKFHANPRGESAVFDVAYQGPKPIAELVLENWNGPNLLSSTVVMRRKFGSHSIRKEGNATQHGVGEAFLQTQQRYSIWIDELPEPYPDGRNALIRILISDPSQSEEQGAQLDNALARIDSLDGGGFGQISGFNARVNGSDSEAAEVWHDIHHLERDVSTAGPPYAEGVITSRLLYRVVDG